MRRSHLSVMIVILATTLSCRAAQQTPSSETKFIATAADMEKAYVLLNQKSQIGACSWQVKWVDGQVSKKIALKLTIAEDGLVPYSIDETFGNEMGHISRVDVKYGALGMGEAHSLFMEKIESGTGFAHRYQLTFSINSAALDNLHVNVVRGSSRGHVLDKKCDV